jgi:hypothetical protein
VTRFSTPRTTPPPVATPIAVDPSLIASREYSTWNRRPSGEKVLLRDQLCAQARRFGEAPKGTKKTYLIPRSIAALVIALGCAWGTLLHSPYSDRAINILKALEN